MSEEKVLGMPVSFDISPRSCFASAMSSVVIHPLPNEFGSPCNPSIASSEDTRYLTTLWIDGRGLRFADVAEAGGRPSGSATYRLLINMMLTAISF